MSHFCIVAEILTSVNSGENCRPEEMISALTKLDWLFPESYATQMQVAFLSFKECKHSLWSRRRSLIQRVAELQL